MMQELYIGLMSGTSLDAIDASLVDFYGNKPKLLATYSLSLHPQLKKEILDLCVPGLDEINRMGRLDVQIGELFATAANNLLNKANIQKEKIRAIGSHGQTVRHHPQQPYPFTLQIGDPNVIAAKTGIMTIADFRRGDVALGGQGAPLAPAFHNFIFRSENEDRIILNLGGIANITFLAKNPNAPVIGFDTGPGNTLLDAWASKHLNKNYDENGNWAANGEIDFEFLKILTADPYFQKSHPKSTGREHFNLPWLEKYLTMNIQSQNIQTTLCELTAFSISQAINKLTSSGKIIVCGGGINNHYLIERLKINCPTFTVHSTEEFGIHPQWIESVTWAWLAYQTVNKKAGNLPSVTGAKREAVLGGIFISH